MLLVRDMLYKTRNMKIETSKGPQCIKHYAQGVSGTLNAVVQTSYNVECT